MPAFDLFIAGRPVTSMEGVPVTLTADQLQGIAGRYDPTLHEAPIILGHPQHDAPALGWVSSLSFADNRLQADEKQLDAGFVQARSEGRFKKVSARFFTPSSPNNPTPGEYYLRDVGFLGAMTPAMKGLGTYSFADHADDQVVTAELSFADLPAYTGRGIAGMFRRLREWLITSAGADAADRVLPNWEIESLTEAAAAAEAERDDDDMPGALPSLSYADPATHPPQERDPMTNPNQAQALLAEKARADRAEADLAALRASQAASTAKAAADARHATHVSFADGLVAEARWPAGARDVLIATLDHVAAPSGPQDAVLSFGDGDQAKPLHDALREQLQALLPMLSFSEVATKRAAGEQRAGEVVSFADQGYAGVAVDADRAALDQRIKHHMAEHKVDYATAAAAIVNK